MSQLPRKVGAFAVLALALLAGCASTPAAQLTVLAASSLANTLPDLATAWKKTHPQTDIQTSTGSSAALRTQIEQGSPADALLSADTSNPQALLDEGDATGTLVEYATNVLTVVVPADNPAAIQTPADLARSGVCVIAAGTDVPITKYAEQLVTNLAARPEYGSAFAQAYEANICSREDNVGAVVNKISLGEGDAAIVYVTDARSAANIKTIAIPADSNVVATYGGVVVKSSLASAAATDFLAWLRGADAQAVLAAHGFGAAP